MSSTKSINNNQTLKEQLISDLASKSHSLKELSEKYSISIKDLFFWLKTLESHINNTISDVSNILPPVDDKEWLSMTLREQEEFIDYLDSFIPDGDPLTIEDLDKKLSSIKKQSK